MKISDIKDKGLRELAELRRKEDIKYDYSDILNLAFEWDETPEDMDYWSDVYVGKITTLDKTPSEGLIAMKDLRIQYLENENRELKERLERWEKEMELQLIYATYERKEKRKLIDELSIHNNKL